MASSHPSFPARRVADAPCGSQCQHEHIVQPSPGSISKRHGTNRSPPQRAGTAFGSHRRACHGPTSVDSSPIDCKRHNHSITFFLLDYPFGFSSLDLGKQRDTCRSKKRTNVFTSHASSMVPAPPSPMVHPTETVDTLNFKHLEIT